MSLKKLLTSNLEPSFKCFIFFCFFIDNKLHPHPSTPTQYNVLAYNYTRDVDTLSFQCGPPSAALARHRNNIGSTFCVRLVGLYYFRIYLTECGRAGESPDHSNRQTIHDNKLEPQ